MERVFVLLKRKPGITFEEFRDHYENSHALLGEKYFGHLFRSYRRNYIPAGVRFSDGASGENAYDCLTELVFHDAGGYAELKRIAGKPEIRAVLVEDEARFLDRTVSGNAIAVPIESDLSRFH
ncbi:MAG: EthD domain-containing protein [Novosphingobium sp.]|nr:EthD domain-containing protein [Novosphingobium sp.]